MRIRIQFFVVEPSSGHGKKPGRGNLGGQGRKSRSGDPNPKQTSLGAKDSSDRVRDPGKGGE